MTLRLKVVDSRVGIHNAFTRMPFRFGVVTMTAAPVATLEVTVETTDGRRERGYAGDFLAYKWFDKRPEKTAADNVHDLLSAMREARAIYQQAEADTPFALWRSLHPEIERVVLETGFNRLGASFASSMVERAIIDAAGRLSGQSFHRMVHDDTLGIRPQEVLPELSSDDMLAALPETPLERVALRHTVGLVDPLSAADVEPDARIDDGFPETLEAYLHEDKLRYLKVKVSGEADKDIDRLTRIAEILRQHDRPVSISLDGNEQYRSIDGFAELMEHIRATPALADFYKAILFIEQPLTRDVAMDEVIGPEAAATIGRPLIIDEADGWTTAFHEATRLGYHGVSHKNCKGVFRSLVNSALAHRLNSQAGEQRYFLSAEDLTTLPVVPLQADLAVVATLGIPHVERNGHHYFRGLDHLPGETQEAALAAHPDLYERRAGGVSLRISEGGLQVSSLQLPGLGVGTPPSLETAIPEETWSFDMLAREDS
ncbi:mandelate racemase [Fodinicurvata halophila]|uniref:Mandelate racemase n=1 Tax=Fodinicurvata halophila TaxID=1419723 RepID=A0ABV8UQ66_9PROT